MNFPRIHAIADLAGLGIADPFGAATQFRNFCTAKVDYPIVLVNRRHLAETFGTLSRLVLSKELTWQDTPRRSDVVTLPDAERRFLLETYGDTAWFMDHMPPLVYRPARATPVPESIEGRLDRQSAFDLPRIEERIGAELDVAWRPRFKHSILVPGRAGGERAITNTRFDAVQDAGIYAAEVIRHDDGTPDVTGIQELFRAETRSWGFSGPEDPRYVVLDSTILTIFNALVTEEGARVRRLFVHSSADGAVARLTVPGHALAPVEKNWAPFVLHDELYLVYAFQPLTVLRCTDLRRGTCAIVHAEGDGLPADVTYPWGGTNLCLWRHPIYVGFGHSRQPWRAVPVVLDVEAWRCAWAGPLELPESAGEAANHGKKVQYPYHLGLDHDAGLLSVCVGDRTNLVVRLGIRALGSVWEALAEATARNPTDLEGRKLDVHFTDKVSAYRALADANARPDHLFHHHFNAGDHANAFKVARDMVRNIGDGHAWYLLGRVLRRMGRCRRAAAAFERALGAGLRHELLLREMTRVYLELGDTEAAARLVHAALEEETGDALLWRKLSQIEMQRGDLDAALSGIDRAIALIPARGAFHMFRSRVCEARGDMVQALASAERAIALLPEPNPNFVRRRDRLQRAVSRQASDPGIMSNRRP